MALDTSPTSTASALAACRAASPLVQCITNFVSMDIMANTLLAAGASPAMAHSIGEVEAFVSIASALLINVGTLSDGWVGGMKLGAQRAVELSKPWVLDPVGCGATPYRSLICAEMLQLKPTVVRGNASEIMALAGAAGAATRGVDSTAAASEALAAAKQLAAQHGCIVAVSGAEDLVTDGKRVLRVANGIPMLQQITASGCSVTALIAAFVSQFPKQPLEATAHALSYFGLAAELAVSAGGVKGPGSLRVGLLDQLAAMSEGEVLAGARVLE